MAELTLTTFLTVDGSTTGTGTVVSVYRRAGALKTGSFALE